jgi:DNA polymerase
VQNLPQNKLKDIDLAREMLKARKFDELELLFGNVPDTLSQLIRTAFIARPGCRLIPVDFSAIEARVIAWLAWCTWRLDVFKTHGMIYEASASAMFKVSIDSIQAKVNGKKVKGPNFALRQKGKIAELALGYQGGAGALKTMGALEMGIPEEELDGIKEAWREANPEIVELWYAVERAAIRAVQNKAVVPVEIGPPGRGLKLEIGCSSGFMTIKLPSGRKLYYVKPRIEASDLMRQKKDGTEYPVARAGSLTYEGVDQKTKQWTRLATYGGKLVENITQAVARDCLADAMLALDAAQIDQLFTVHDEDVTEVPYGMGTLEEIEEIMGRPLAWAPELPLRGDGFETEYYMKEID